MSTKKVIMYKTVKNFYFLQYKWRLYLYSVKLQNTDS